MAGPSWVAGAFAAMMILIAVYCAARLVASRRWHRPTAVDADGLHLVMGVAMAGMLAPRLSLLPATVWAGVFGVAAAWFAAQAALARRGSTVASWRCRYPVPHLVECGAMLYMLLAALGTRPAGQRGMAMPAMTGSPGAAASVPALALILALFMLGYIVWTTDRLATQARVKTAAATRSTASDHARVPEHPGSVRMLAPQLAETYKIGMGIAMGYMLILMV